MGGGEGGVLLPMICFTELYQIINICISLIYKHITYFTALSVSFGNRNKPTLKIVINLKDYKIYLNLPPSAQRKIIKTQTIKISELLNTHI